MSFVCFRIASKVVYYMDADYYTSVTRLYALATILWASMRESRL